MSYLVASAGFVGEIAAVFVALCAGLVAVILFIGGFIIAVNESGMLIRLTPTGARD